MHRGWIKRDLARSKRFRLGRRVFELELRESIARRHLDALNIEFRGKVNLDRNLFQFPGESDKGIDGEIRFEKVLIIRDSRSLLTEILTNRLLSYSPFIGCLSDRILNET